MKHSTALLSAGSSKFWRARFQNLGCTSGLSAQSSRPRNAMPCSSQLRLTARECFVKVPEIQKRQRLTRQLCRLWRHKLRQSALLRGDCSFFLFKPIKRHESYHKFQKRNIFPASRLTCECCSSYGYISTMVSRLACLACSATRELLGNDKLPAQQGLAMPLFGHTGCLPTARDVIEKIGAVKKRVFSYLFRPLRCALSELGSRVSACKLSFLVAIPLRPGSPSVSLT